MGLFYGLVPRLSNILGIFSEHNVDNNCKENISHGKCWGYGDLTKAHKRPVNVHKVAKYMNL